MIRKERWYSKPFDPILLKEKLRAILSVCADHGHDAVVLGAIGCGAFNHEPRTVSKVFAELLKNEFRCFRVAIFAILFKGQVFNEFDRGFPSRFRDGKDLDAKLLEVAQLREVDKLRVL